MARKYRPGIVLIDAGYGNNTSFLLELEFRQLKYLGGLAKNRKVTINISENLQQTIRLDELAQSLPKEAFTKIELNLDKPRTVWVVTREIEISQLKGKRSGCYRHERCDFLAQPLILTILSHIPHPRVSQAVITEVNESLIELNNTLKNPRRTF